MTLLSLLSEEFGKNHILVDGNIWNGRKLKANESHSIEIILDTLPKRAKISQIRQVVKMVRSLGSSSITIVILNEQKTFSLASICSGAMMMETLGEEDIAQAIDHAVYKALDSGKIKNLAAGQMGMSTTDVGDLVASMV